MSHECQMCDCEVFKELGQMCCSNYYRCLGCGWEVAFLTDEDPLNPRDEREEDEEEEYESEWDGQPDEAQEWHDFDPDC